MKKVIETSMAIAEGVKLCSPDVIPMYPITPQTHIVEAIAKFINDGKLDAEMIHVESEHSALSAALGASAYGSRAYTATASQGLALMHEVLYVVSGMRLPVVMSIANRALSAPINIWNDHQDSITSRDTGWIQFYCESAQEALDTTIMAFKVAENKKVLLPAMVCIDGFSLSHVYEPVDIPSKSQVKTFLPPYKPTHAFLNPKKPMTQGPVGFPNSFMDFRNAQQQAMNEALKLIKDTNKAFKRTFKRSYGNGLIETYKIEKADYAIMGMGSICGSLRVVVDDLRKQGYKVGMIKVKTFRPFPEDEIVEACKKVKNVVVFDRNISVGGDGALFTEVRNALYDQKKKPVVKGIIAGLGGRDVNPCHLESALYKISKSKKLVEWMF